MPFRLMTSKYLVRRYTKGAFSKKMLKAFQKEVYWKSWKAFFPKCCGQIAIHYYFLNHAFFGYGLTCRFSCKIFLSKKDPLAKIAKRNAKRILKKLAIIKYIENQETLKSFLKCDHKHLLWNFKRMRWR